MKGKEKIEALQANQSLVTSSFFITPGQIMTDSQLKSSGAVPGIHKRNQKRLQHIKAPKIIFKKKDTSGLRIFTFTMVDRKGGEKHQ